MKIGIGFDIHPLVEKRKLILGGIEIPFGLGAKGHSDADVCIHALIDALLGAMGKGDIGEHFPDTDIKYKDISSVELLKKIKKLLDQEKYQIQNIDCNIFLEKPKLKEYKQKIKENIAKILLINSNCVNIKAKTYEQLGDIGQSKAVAAEVVVLINIPS